MTYTYSSLFGPERLAICRILTCAILIYFFGKMDYAPFCSLPEEFWDPISLFKYLHIVRLPYGGVLAIQAIFLASLGLCVLGVAVRPVAAIALASSAYLCGFVNCFGKVIHSDTIIPFVLLILASSRCGDAYAVWPRRRGRVSKPARGEDEYTWPIWGVWILFGLIFGAAGVAKLRYSGFDWITSDNMSRILRTHYLSPTPPSTDLAMWIADSHLLCSVLAASTIALETLAPLVIISRLARGILVPGIAVMLLGMWVLLGFAFYRYSILFVWFIPFDRLFERGTAASAPITAAEARARGKAKV